MEEKKENKIPWWCVALSIISPLVGWTLWGVWHNNEEDKERAKIAAYIAWISFCINLVVQMAIN